MEEIAEAVRQLKFQLESHIKQNETQFCRIDSQLSQFSQGKTMSEIPEVKITNNPSDNLGAIMALAGNRNNDGMLGGGGIGLIALLALMNRGGFGLGGGENVGGVVTPALLASSLAQVTDTQLSSSILEGVSDVKAAVPLAEAQVQLALAGTQAELAGQINASQLSNLAGHAVINKNISDAIAASLASQNNINVNVLTQSAAVKEAVTSFGVANLTATKDAQYATQVSISNSTKEILAALNEQNTANLQRQLTVAEQALLERNAESRSREVEVNVTQSVTQNQNQLQLQSQQQQQFQILANLSAVVGNLANDIQVVRQGQTIFNSGTMAASGTQAAANTRVN